MYSTRLVTAMLLAGLGLVGMGTPTSVFAQDGGAERADGELAAGFADAPLVDVQVRELLQNREYERALAAMDEAMGAPEAPRDYLAYLKGRTLHLAEQYDRAAAAFRQFQEQFPDSRWLRRARFGEALAYARQGDYRRAELIYRGEAEFLLSEQRRQAMADIYLEYAERYFEPPKAPDAKPDYEKALTFFTKALEMGPELGTRQTVDLRIARCHQELGRHEEAAKRYQEFIETHAGSALEVEARYRLGESLLAQNQYVQARRAWQDLLAAHRDSSSERMAEAMFQLSRTWQIPKPPGDKQLSLGVATLEAFLRRFPTHESASRARLETAQSYMFRGQYEEAVESLEKFLQDDRYRDREELADARNLLGRCYQLQKKFTDALSTWQDYLVQHPAHEAWSSVQREIMDTEYLMAFEERGGKRYDESRKLFQQFVAKYPLDQRNPQILYGYGEMNHEQERWQAAIDDWKRLVSKFPKSNEASRGQFMIAATLEAKLGQLDEALDEYRKVTGVQQTEAQKAIARLTAKSLSVVTQRTFRSDETPHLKVSTRNVEKVTVRAYKLDLETYFRKMHAASGVEKLDIALIDPDTTFDFPVPDYQPYQLLESTVEVPLPDTATAGVMAVTVSSETREATTVVLQSDLEIIVKSSRDELFVFAEDMLSGKPWPGAQLLISNGNEVFAQATTGDDGVFQQSYKELQEAEDVRVLAVDGGNVASNNVALQGVGVAQGLANKGYLYTDRPAYRAGDLIHVRGCLRHAENDRYVVPEDKKYTLQTFDPRNRLIRQEEVQLGTFGSFHTHFVLPETSPQGNYRIVAVDEEDRSYQGTFVVHEYKLEPVRLIIDTPRHVYYRGEEIEGTIRAEFYHGGPLAGRQIRFQLAGERVHTVTTDENGEVAFRLPTREFPESQVLPLVVSLPERNLQRAVNFFLSTQGFSVSLKTPRSVYVAGESFEVSLHTRDAEGEPIAREMTLRVLERTEVQGKVGERLVEEHALASDDEGTVRKTLSLDRGGRYVLRATGTDRFENIVSGELVLQISDDADTVRLRVLADRHSHKVGDRAKVRIHWRENPALALITFQGARVLKYELVELKRGANDLEIPMTSLLAPNFELAVAVMTDPRPKDGWAKEVQRFHSASSPFTVQRDLRVEVSYRRTGEDKGPLRPGEEVEVTLQTTDPQGQPVVAEVGLVLVEQALLDRFPWQVAAIDAFFRGNLRKPAVRTASSIVFSYRPSTRPINPRLLAEWRRLEIERDEAASATVAYDVEEAGEFSFGIPFRRGVAMDDGLDLSFEQGAQRNLAALRLNGDMPQPATSGVAGAFYDQGQMSASRPSQARGRFEDRFGRLPASYENLVQLGQQNRDSVLVLVDGTVQSVDLFAGGRFDAAAAEALAKRLADRGAVLLPDVGPQETGYWNPAVVTDDDGLARVTLTLPERSTAWSLAAKGLTRETLAGETTQELVVKKELFGEIKLPLAFTDGDSVDVPVTVHNSALEEGKITVLLTTTVDGRSVSETKTIDVASAGTHELTFHRELGRNHAESAKAPAEIDVEFELVVSDGQLTDRQHRMVPLQPYGMSVFATSSGSATSDTTAWLELSQEMPFRAPNMKILIGPTVERSLVDIVLAPAPWCQTQVERIAAPLEGTTSNLMASLGLLDLLSASRSSGGPTLQAIDRQVRSGISALVSSQNDDGGWSWTGRGGVSDRYASSRAAWALALARAKGYRIPAENFDLTVGYLKNQVAATSNSDYESRAILLHALTVAGHDDFALANRLYRNRPSLSPTALAHLALVFADMDRTTTASELLQLLGERNLDDAATRRQQPTGRLPWSHSGVEVRALYALALEEVDPTGPRTKELVDWLMAHRTGNRWQPAKATGPAALALCIWYARSRFEGEAYQLSIAVNGQEAAVLEIEPESLTQMVDVPGELLTDGKQRISFQITGRGRYTYQCILGGFVAADQLKSTTKICEVRRYYEPAPLERDGKQVPRGFDVLTGSYSSFRNPLTQLPVARRAQVELRLWRTGVADNTPDSQLEYLVVTEPIPCGARVVVESVKGGFERYEIAPGEITFYVGSRRSIGTIRYELIGYLAGQFRAAPTVVRDAYRPDRIMVTEPKSLAVLPSGAASRDEYRLTPRELYELGKMESKAGQLPEAQAHLEELVEKWNLRAEVYKEAVTTLLDIHLQIGPPAKVVHYFEIVREKWPSEQIPFDKILKVGKAYDEMGEFERSYLVFRATVESRFSRESSVAGFLESQDEFLRSVDVMGELLQQYPAEPYIAAATYALAQRVYAKAPQAAEDARLREQKVNRVDLIRRTWRMLESFLAAYPSDPAADQAAFAAANTLLDLESFEPSAAACQRYAERYPESDLLDSFWYIIGYCHFALGNHEQASSMCRKVIDAKRLDPGTGREEESPNKWRAVYILGQIHHSLGEAAKAIEQYRRVEERFPDAAQSIEYFMHRQIRLPEVTTVDPGKPVKVELMFRNIASCDTKVYRIDLMKFGLLKRDLQGIRNINLSGIRPYHEATIELGDGNDYRDRTQSLPLPLDTEGAYLVVCRGENLYTSGLVLVTPLAMEIQEDAVSGRVRTTVKDRIKDDYLSDVHVKVIGSRNDDFVSGESDLRGVFVADGIVGTSTVIAQADPSRYAFFRGEEQLGPQEVLPAEGAVDAAAAADAAAPQAAESLKQQLLEGLKGTNLRLQQLQVEEMDMLYEAPAEGVEVQKAIK